MNNKANNASKAKNNAANKPVNNRANKPANNAANKPANNRGNKLNNKGNKTNNSNSNNSFNTNNSANNSANNSSQSTSLYKEIAIGVVIVLVVGLLIYFGSRFIKNMLLGKSDSPWILQQSKNAKNSLVITQDPKNENSITLYRSDNQDAGAEFTYSFWFVIENMEYKYGEFKHMFHKGNKSANPNKAPGVFIHDTKNTVRIYMNTLQNINEYVDIDNIPLKRWVHMAIVLKGKYLDIYVNGYLRKRHELTSVVKQNFGDLWLNLFGGFEGYMCRMRYYRRALEFTEVEDIVRKGPSTGACGDTGDKPPYLDDNWWYDF